MNSFKSEFEIKKFIMNSFFIYYKKKYIKKKIIDKYNI